MSVGLLYVLAVISLVSVTECVEEPRIDVEELRIDVEELRSDVEELRSDEPKIFNELDSFKYQDCNDVRYTGGYEVSGAYRVFLNTSTPFTVVCRFEVDATYSSIMQQKYGLVNFYRGWYDYTLGFGSMGAGDFWLGLRNIKALADNRNNVLTVTLQDWTNTIKVLRYNYFALGNEADGFPLHLGGYASSRVLPDDFSHNNGAKFATYDRPDHNNCAAHQKGGWWYNYCTFTLPTGRYYPYGPYQPVGGFYDGIYYKDWEGFGYSLKYIRMDLSLY